MLSSSTAAVQMIDRESAQPTKAEQVAEIFHAHGDFTWRSLLRLGVPKHDATLLSFLGALVIACSINPTRGGEVGVYQSPDENVKNTTPDDKVSSADATLLGEESEVVVGDTSDGSPDAPLEPSQDSGQCIGKEYPAVLNANKSLAVYIVVEATEANLRAAPLWSLLLSSNIVNAPENAGISSIGFKFVGPDAQCDSMFAEPTLPIASLSESVIAWAMTMATIVPPLAPVAGAKLHPTLPVLKGAIQYARSYAQSHQDSRVVVWLLTDGLPDECDSTVENVAQVAKEALAPPTPIATYVLGIYESAVDDLRSLDQIAQNGGTEKATLVAFVDADVTQIAWFNLAVVTRGGSNTAALAFLDAMSEQQRSVLPCEYALPTPVQDEPIAHDLINLYFTPNGGQKSAIYRVTGTDSCDPDKGGWFYNATRTGLITCDKNCDAFKNTPGEVSIEIGCSTIVL